MGHSTRRVEEVRELEGVIARLRALANAPESYNSESKMRALASSIADEMEVALPIIRPRGLSAASRQKLAVSISKSKRVNDSLDAMCEAREAHLGGPTTPTRLAKEIGLAKSLMVYYRAGRYPCPRSVHERICRALGARLGEGYWRRGIAESK